MSDARVLAAPGDAWHATLSSNGNRAPSGRWETYADGPDGQRGDLVIARAHRRLDCKPILLVLPTGEVWCPHAYGPDGQWWTVLGGLVGTEQLTVPKRIRVGTWSGFVWDGRIVEEFENNEA